jgi:SagB-type dehydrogenase family enzyme
LIRQLVRQSFLHQSNRPEPASEKAMRVLSPWNPEAGFFHMVTKDVRFVPSGRSKGNDGDVAEPVRVPVKRYPGAAHIDLPAPDGPPEFSRIVRRRRTWRRFSRTPVTKQDLATILGFSVGIQQWMRLTPTLEVPLKTSPSGGARHPIECYIVARDVDGIAPGLYHYSAHRHVLAKLRSGASAAQVRSYLPRSGYFARASAVALFTAVFKRQLSRYPYSRAYRASLIEAGHVCQMFCLTATALGMAPFSLMALADSIIERDLGIDGITETVLYAAGVGRPPANTESAPRPRGTVAVRDNPRLRPRNR